MEARIAALVDAYRVIGARDMADVPICNAALSVEAVGFRAQGPGWLGCVIAPWFLNSVLIPRDPAEWAARMDGDKTEVTLPSGAYRFTAARMDGLGTLLVIPLVSAMNVLSSQEEARAAANLALDTLLTPPAPTPAPEPPTAMPETPALSRRTLFRGGRR